MRRVSFLAVAVLTVVLPLHTIAQSSLPTPPAVRARSTDDVRRVLPGTSKDVFTTIQGTALNADNSVMADTGVRLRDARSGRIVDSTVTDRTGLFTFRSVDPGSYIVELLGADRNVVAASQILNVNAGDALSAVVKLPFRTRPFAGVLGHTASSAMLVISAAAASGVLATEIAGEQKSPRQ